MEAGDALVDQFAPCCSCVDTEVGVTVMRQDDPDNMKYAHQHTS